MPLEVEAWCLRVLGHGTLTSLRADAGGQMSRQFRYDSNGLGVVVVKVRADSADRTSRRLQIQGIAADTGFSWARSLTGGDLLQPGLVVSAETVASGHQAPNRWFAPAR